MNDLANIALIYICYMFTDLIDDTKVQYNFGYWFILVMLLCVAIHLFFIFYYFIIELKLQSKTS